MNYFILIIIIIKIQSTNKKKLITNKLKYDLFNY